MRILVINGSPKGENSITLQTVLYMQIHNPSHSFTFLHAGQRIKSLEKDFSEAKALLENADLILFSYPVYTFLAPSQLHRFIGLMKENDVNISRKYTSQITTSKHFYDMTAHTFVEENMFDLGALPVKGLSADMDDLTTGRGRKDALRFFERLEWSVLNDVHLFPASQRAQYASVPATIPADAIPESNKRGDVVIVADLDESDLSLQAMIGRFRAVCSLKTRIVNIRTFPFSGGCLGCFGCASDGKCVYKDGFDSMLREQIQTAQAIVLAFSVKDHSMGHIFKMYDDRQFCNGHRTVTSGTPFGYLISGPVGSESNLSTVIRARAEVGGNYLAGIATDEKNTDTEIDTLAKQLCYAVEKSYTQPSDFYGVGGMKIFRDLIWLMRGMMKADHRFFKANGQYDFPQKKPGTVLKMYVAGALIGNRRIRAKAGSKITEGMLSPYKAALKK